MTLVRRQIALYGMVLHFTVWYFMVQSSIYIADPLDNNEEENIVMMK